MFRFARVMVVAATAAGCLSVGSGAELNMFGSIAGEVRNAAGVGQMGAAVVLLNRYEKVIYRALTSPDGRFHFDTLTPDVYSIRVSLNSYVPAMRNNVPVRAGSESFLNIQLANLFSSIELVYTAPGQPGLLSEDWKWTLRSSTATRPVLRILPDPQWTKPSSSFASSMRGVVNVSAGDQGGSSMLGSEPDMGTAFAVATSIASSELAVSGNIGYASAAGVPTAGFRTRYAHPEQSSFTPDVELTVRQAALRQRAAQGVVLGPGSPVDMPLLRTMSVKVSNSQAITDKITLEYGALLEAVSFMERMSMLSPYGRISYDLGGAGRIEGAFSSGAPPLDLILSSSPELGSQDGLTGLAMFPRVTMSGGQPHMQRTTSYEITYKKIDGPRAYSATFYQDQVDNAAVTVGGASGGMLASADLVPDLASDSSVFDAGNYRASGYMGTVSQRVGDNWVANVSGGYSGALAPGNGLMSDTGASSIHDFLRPVNLPWAAAGFSGHFRATGTQLSSSYMWAAGNTLGPAHAYLTQRVQPQLGLNFMVRQPIPTVGGMPGRLEMSAELRNLLAQGYVPVSSADGRTLYLIQFPRVIRGGISFIF